jgi:hypothetical protein
MGMDVGLTIASAGSAFFEVIAAGTFRSRGGEGISGAFTTGPVGSIMLDEAGAFNSAGGNCRNETGVPGSGVPAGAKPFLGGLSEGVLSGLGGIAFGAVVAGVVVKTGTCGLGDVTICPGKAVPCCPFAALC